MGTNSDESSSGTDGARKKQVAFVGFAFFVVFTAFNLTQAGSLHHPTNLVGANNKCFCT